MKCDRILNAPLIEAIAAVGHTQMVVICDAGLPVPKGVRCIDLSLVKGVPSFEAVLNAVARELVVEKAIWASESQQKNPAIVEMIRRALPEAEGDSVPHETLKTLSQDAVAIIRTGECTPYANVVLVAGVNF